MISPRPGKSAQKIKTHNSNTLNLIHCLYNSRYSQKKFNPSAHRKMMFPGCSRSLQVRPVPPPSLGHLQFQCRLLLMRHMCQERDGEETFRLPTQIHYLQRVNTSPLSLHPPKEVLPPDIRLLEVLVH